LGRDIFYNTLKEIVMKNVVLALALAGLMGGASMVYAQETMTDAKIVKLVRTANDGEIDLAKMAKSKADNKDVKDFAKMMIDEHKKNDKDAKDVAKKANVKPEDSTAAKDLKNMAEGKEKELKKFKGKEFDKAYIDQQISMHQQLLDDLNNKLIPAAQSPDVKTYLEATKAHVEKHLSRAQEIQTSLNQ
jgi:putative membrane protein